MYLLYIYFIFKSTKMLRYFAASNQQFTGMPINQTHDIEYSASILDIQQNNVLHFNIFYNISIFSFLSLCVSKCVA